MVRLQISERTRSRLQALADVQSQHQAEQKVSQSNEASLKELAEALDNLTSQEPLVLEHGLVVKAARLASALLPPKQIPLYAIDALLQGCTVYHAPKPKFVRSPELEATLAQIRRQQDEAEYQNMVHGLVQNGPGAAYGSQPGAVTHGASLADEWREVNSHLSAMFNIGLSLVAVVMATWWASGQYTAIEVKVALCSGFGFIIVGAEAFLYARHFDRQRSKEMEKRKGLKGKLTSIPGSNVNLAWDTKDLDLHSTSTDNTITLTK